MLTVYVDDLLLSGPVGGQEKVWTRLRKHISIEDPEQVDRFLGRTHILNPLPKP